MKNHIYPTRLLPYLLGWLAVFAPVAADAQQLYLTGLVLVGDPTQAQNTFSAWVLDRAKR